MKRMPFSLDPLGFWKWPSLVVVVLLPIGFYFLSWAPGLEPEPFGTTIYGPAAIGRWMVVAGSNDEKLYQLRFCTGCYEKMRAVYIATGPSMRPPIEAWTRVTGDANSLRASPSGDGSHLVGDRARLGWPRPCLLVAYPLNCQPRCHSRPNPKGLHFATLNSSMQPNGARFATTQWTLVLAAGRRGSAEAEAALARLCALYWYPVFAFVRRRGHGVEDAEDLTQSFFARLIEKEDVAAADRSRGRFRTFLLTACEHFLLNEQDRSRTVKRGGGFSSVPIDLAAAEERYQRSLSHGETPERLYDRQWCLTLLASVLDSVRDEYAAAGNGALFERLRGFLTMDETADTHAVVACDLAMTAAAVKVAIHRLRRRYRNALLERVAETVDTDDAVDEEMRYLLKIVSDV